MQRILCPVDGCPESTLNGSRHFSDFSNIRNHLNAHYFGHLSGAIPHDFLSQYGFSVCNVCGKIIHSKYHGSCPSCKPTARNRARLNAMRSQESSTSNQHIPSSHESRALPSLSLIHEQFVPTIRNIPLGLRRLWTQCITKALAQATWSNNISAWTELQMLAKCTLCRPPRGGKAHKSKRLSWTQNRLNRWLAGE